MDAWSRPARFLGATSWDAGREGLGVHVAGTTEQHWQPSAAMVSPDDQESDNSFQKRQAFKKRSWFHIDESQMDKYKSVFNTYDADSSGFIEVAELGKVFGVLGIQTSDQELEQLITDVDADGNGTLDFDEFIDAIRDGLSTRCVSSRLRC